MMLRQPVSEIESMPISELRGWAEYLGKCVTPELAIEAAVVRLHRSFIQANSKGGTAPRIEDMMISKSDPWRDDEVRDDNPDDVFASIAAAVGSAIPKEER